MKTNIHIGGRKAVCPDEVVLLIANENYTQVVCTDGTKLLVATTLKELERRFCRNPYFVRTHKSFVVNLQYISNYQSLEDNFIEMVNDTKVTVSRRRKQVLQERIFNFK
ncbi:MAG: LytTR family transcriptional regulator [Spirosomaceae bacterium]|jgi:two-component system LytT family response regulator|nr:LytTR family transcriptional regulator [Spirosomataceae bacterium]